MIDQLALAQEVADHNDQHQDQRDTLKNQQEGVISPDVTYEDADKATLDKAVIENRSPEGDQLVSHDVKDNSVPGETHTVVFADNEVKSPENDAKLDELKKEAFLLAEKVRQFFEQHDRYMVAVQDERVKSFLALKGIDINKFDLFTRDGENLAIADFNQFARDLEGAKTSDEIKAALENNKKTLEENLSAMNVAINNVKQGEMTWLNDARVNTSHNPEADNMKQWQFDELEDKVASVDYEFNQLETDMAEITKRYQGAEDSIKTR